MIAWVYNFVVIYSWNLLFFQIVVHFLSLSIVFYVCKWNFTAKYLPDYIYGFTTGKIQSIVLICVGTNKVLHLYDCAFKENCVIGIPEGIRPSIQEQLFYEILEMHCRDLFLFKILLFAPFIFVFTTIQVSRVTIMILIRKTILVW